MTEPKRAKKGTTTARLLLKLEPELKEAAERAADVAGVSISEWWRQAARAALHKQRPR